MSRAPGTPAGAAPVLPAPAAWWQTKNSQYDKVLPSFNLIYDVGPDVVLRFTGAEVIAWAPYNQMVNNTFLNDSTLTGAGGNIGVSIGEDGIVIIDDQFAPLSPKIHDALAKLSNKPIRFVINTHWHGDHTGGNEVFGKEGSIIVAQENVRKRLSETQFSKLFNSETPPHPRMPCRSSPSSRT